MRPSEAMTDEQKVLDTIVSHTHDKGAGEKYGGGSQWVSETVLRRHFWEPVEFERAVHRLLLYGAVETTVDMGERQYAITPGCYRRLLARRE